MYLPIGWSTYFFSAARVTFNTSEVARAKEEVRRFLVLGVSVLDASVLDAAALVLGVRAA